MNLKDFSQKYTGKIKENIEKTVKEMEADLKVENKDEYDEVKSMYQKYNNLSQDELEQELFSMIQSQKESGTFDAQSLQNTYQMLLPMLNEEQREKLEHYMKLIV